MSGSDEGDLTELRSRTIPKKYRIDKFQINKRKIY